MDYRLPELSDEKLLQEYVEEHRRNGETSITASFGLSSTPYAEWAADMVSRVSVPNDFGRSLLYLCFDDGKLIGLLSVRYELPDELAEKYGHIGYGVRPSERRKGYASEMLRYGLEVCREKGLHEVILGCYKDNIGSAGTIEKNGGVLYAENDNYQKGRLSRYYKITLQGRGTTGHGTGQTE